MRAENVPKVRVVLLGLDDYLDRELGEVLAGEGLNVYRVPFASGREWLRGIRTLNPDIVFCPSDRNRYLPLIEAVREPGGRGTAIVVVSGAPEVSDWLDAMDAGASDYCAAPFDSRQLGWIVDTTLKHRDLPAAHHAT